jgi:predicted ABC-type sugar transport system permease subunit
MNWMGNLTAYLLPNLNLNTLPFIVNVQLRLFYLLAGHYTYTNVGKTTARRFNGIFVSILKWSSLVSIKAICNPIGKTTIQFLIVLDD